MQGEGLVRRDKSFEEALRNVAENVIKGRKRKYRVSLPDPIFLTFSHSDYGEKMESPLRHTLLHFMIDSFYKKV